MTAADPPVGFLRLRPVSDGDRGATGTSDEANGTGEPSGTAAPEPPSDAEVAAAGAAAAAATAFATAAAAAAMERLSMRGERDPGARRRDRSTTTAPAPASRRTPAVRLGLAPPLPEPESEPQSRLESDPLPDPARGPASPLTAPSPLAPRSPLTPPPPLPPPVSLLPRPGHGRHRAGTGPVDVAAAVRFLRLFHAEHPAMFDLAARVEQVQREIARTGTYWHTPEELTFGARVAWRNAARCIGRLYWRRLEVRDRRHLHRPGDIADEATTQLHQATNGGRIRPVVTIFAPDTPQRRGPRIWNEQLVGYAGHRDRYGEVVGDRRNEPLTATLREFGWRPPGSSFDLLPLVIDGGDGRPELFELPEQVVAEVGLDHPDYGWFSEMELRWYAVPVVSGLCLDIGGICYPTAPFSRWHLATEVSATGLGGRDRYDLVPLVARQLGLDTSSERRLWRDRSLVELTAAVLYSFDQAGVSIADPQTEPRRFLAHQELERQRGRPVPANWSWLTAPFTAPPTAPQQPAGDPLDLRPAFRHHGSRPGPAAWAAATAWPDATARHCPAAGQ